MILVLSGTKDGRELVEHLSQKGYQVLATAVSKYGGDLLAASGAGEVLVKGLTPEDLKQMLQDKKINLIIDATHPFAQQISAQAMAVAKELELPYLRFERKQAKLSLHPLIHRVSNMEEAAQKAISLGKTIFLTTGSKTLATFLACQKDRQPRIVARVLPDPQVMEKCFQLGLSPCDIVAMQGPFSKQLNKALFQEYGADVVVSKESGKTGGTDSKIEAALELSLPLVIIERPALSYPLVADDVAGVEKLLEGIWDENCSHSLNRTRGDRRQ